MSYGQFQANLSGQSSELGNLATFTPAFLFITNTVRRPNFQTPVLSQGATILAKVSDTVNLESVEHPQQHFMKINFSAYIVILPYSSLSYNTVPYSCDVQPLLPCTVIGSPSSLLHTTRGFGCPVEIAMAHRLSKSGTRLQADGAGLQAGSLGSHLYPLIIRLIWRT